MRTPSRHANGFFGSGFRRASAVLLLLMAAAPAHGQRRGVASTEISVGAVGARPGGEFRETMGDGYGVALRSVQWLNALPWLGLRLDGGLLLQDMEREGLPTSGEGSDDVDLVTSNTLLFLGMGPQVGMTHGAVRPYAHAFGGVHYLVTDAAYQSNVGDRPLEFGGTSFEDMAWAFGGGAGVTVPLGRGRRAAALDLGATYRFGGEATFVRGAVIAVGPNTVAGDLVEGRTDMLVVHLGLTFGGGR